MKFFYFVSDIYVAKVELESNTVNFVRKIDAICSFRDEMHPVFNEDDTSFYFSSNDFPDFGGFDIFKCSNYEQYGPLAMPINPKNLMGGFNTNKNELKAYPFRNNFLLQRGDIYNTTSFFFVTTLPEQIEFDIDLKMSH